MRHFAGQDQEYRYSYRYERSNAKGTTQEEVEGPLGLRPSPAAGPFHRQQLHGYRLAFSRRPAAPPRSARDQR